MYNEHEGPTWTDDHAANYAEIKDNGYGYGAWRDENDKMNNFDFYHMATINGLDYYTPNNEDWGAIIVMDHKNELAEWTGFYEMDDMEAPAPYDDYAFIEHDGKLVPKFTTWK